MDQDCKGRAGYVGMKCVVRPLKMAALLLLVYLPDQSVLHSHDHPILLIIVLNQ